MQKAKDALASISHRRSKLRSFERSLRSGRTPGKMKLALALQQATRSLAALARGNVPAGATAEEFAAQALTRVDQSLSGHKYDNCEVCFGEKGGVRGNENIVDGVCMCDYCTCARRP